MDGVLTAVEYTRVNAGAVTARERIIRETALAVYVNEKYYTTAMIMPVMEKEFVAGHLFGQGLINSAADIKSIAIEDGTASVTLNGAERKNPFPQTISSGLKVSTGDIFHCVKAILRSETFTETEAVHSAGLFQRGRETICIAEDIGRHNALDKAIGYALLHDIDFADTVATSTGRQPSEMVFRCLMAGIPVIATKGVPTTLAIDLAGKAGITIVGLVRGDTLTVYSSPDRIEP